MPDLHAEAFDTLFAGCAADPDCQAAYPELESVFYELLERYAAEPIRIAGQDEQGREIQEWFTDDNMIEGVFVSLYYQSLIPILPLAAYQVRDGNQAIIEALSGDIGEFGIADGLFNTVVCHDVTAFLDKEELQANLAEHPRLAGYWDDYDFDQICELWGAEHAAPAADRAVHSEIPALVLAGEYDPVAPPRYGRETVATLSQGQFFEFPGLTHGVTFLDGCPREMVVGFLEDPTADLDASCIASMGDMPFVTDIYLNAGIYNLASDLFADPNPVIIVLVVLCGLVLLSAVIGLPLAYILARRRDASWTGRPLLVFAGILLWFLAVLLLIFAVALVVTLQEVAATNEYLLAFGLPSSAAGWFVLPWVAVVLGLVGATLAVVAWGQGWWRLLGRVYYTLVSTAALGLVALLFNWRLLSL
jgi:hypothetical protein